MPFLLRPSGMRKSFRTYSHFSHNGNSDLQLLMRLLICLLISTIYSAGKALDLTIVIPSCKSSFRLSCGTYSGSEWRLHISKRIRLLMALKLSSKAVRIMQRIAHDAGHSCLRVISHTIPSLVVHIRFQKCAFGLRLNKPPSKQQYKYCSHSQYMLFSGSESLYHRMPGYS